MDTVLLTAFHQFITVGPCRHTWLSSENVLSDNVSPKVFLLDEIAGRIKASLVPLNCQISIPFNQHIYNGIHRRQCRAHHWWIHSLCRKIHRLPNRCSVNVIPCASPKSAEHSEFRVITAHAKPLRKSTHFLHQYTSPFTTLPSVLFYKEGPYIFTQHSSKH